MPNEGASQTAYDWIIEAGDFVMEHPTESLLVAGIAVLAIIEPTPAGEAALFTYTANLAANG